ncbi:hypothetical protein RSSM_00025 [Rhodopirellula sallentina SM41]|uniref:Uncharacterized protein n=1 Tax=Rhodopirellula sallentina SM41 TaxID=1263870 RepID=M5UR78_9BACT|nr:hypothetical protein RSSM_00025 [Rhodopirellula sallentina SM41]
MTTSRFSQMKVVVGRGGFAMRDKCGCIDQLGKPQSFRELA